MYTERRTTTQLALHGQGPVAWPGGGPKAEIVPPDKTDIAACGGVYLWPVNMVPVI